MQVVSAFILEYFAVSSTTEGPWTTMIFSGNNGNRTSALSGSLGLNNTEGKMKIYQAIAAVQAELAKEGISKGRKNVQQGYQFRGIDDLYNALAPVLSANGLVILPRMIKRDSVERQTAKGGVLFYVTVEAEFDFVAAEDGSKHTVKTFGEAMDSADKATNKAMSAAYKYAAMQAFCIPTEGDNDADATTHEVVPRGLSAPILKKHVDAIRSANSMEELKTAYGTAYKAAHSVRDSVAEEVLAEAKDSRKAELEVPA